jgi:single-strand DNA-binding protein
MASIKNSVRLIGHLGKDPEEINLKNGGKCARFTLATNEYYKDADGVLQKKTQWHRIVAWRKQAELALELLRKGDKVAVDGQLKHWQKEDKEGNMRLNTDVEMSAFELMRKLDKETTSEATPF